MSQKITEKEVAQSLLDSAYVLITQQEDDGSGQKVESLRRIPLSVFLKKCGNGTGTGDGEVDHEVVKQIVDEYLAENPPSGTGTPGRGISSIERTAGDGSPGTTDTYTITYTDGSTNTYTVYNGADGDDGVTPELSIGTVETLEAGSKATASISGTAEKPVLNLGIPRGETGNSSSPNVTLDTTLTKAGEAADAAATGARLTALEQLGGITIIEPAEDDIPKVFFGGPLQQVKEEAVVPFRYISKTQDISGYAEIKAQGNSSMSHPKKNQTVKLFKDTECTEKLKVDFKGWGKQNKHCYKANWIDLTHSRNVVSARLWGDIVKSRANYAELPELLRTSPNQGAIDGFPIKVYAAGIYQGRYTLNIPKDKWMANMDDELDTHCILCGEGYVSGCFREASVAQWTDEVHDSMPNAIKTRWLEVINFVMNSTDDEFKANLGQYFDIDSLIDYHLFGLMSCGLDAYGKNQLFMTYDGQKWYASMYDMDSTWGLYWSGAPLLDPDYGRSEYQDFKDGNGNLLFIRLEQNFAEELYSRWEELKCSALSLENIINRFERFTDIAPAELVKEDYASTTAGGKFANIPSVNSNKIQQIRNFAVARMPWCDAYIENLLPVVAVPCTGISLSASSLSFTEKVSQTLTATLEPIDTTDKVIWESSNGDVATVADGIVTPMGNGTAVITATAGNASAQCSVSVEYAAIPCTGISLNTNSMAIGNNETRYLYATVLPEDTTDNIIWTSDDESVVTVENGEVKSVGTGTATITARCGEHAAECTVTVNAKSLFSDASWSFGGINTSGAETGGTGDVSTGFIDVSEYTDDILIICLNGGSTNQASNRLFWYDENETQIGSYSNNFGQVVPSNAKYLRMSVANDPKLNYADAYRLIRNEEANYCKKDQFNEGSITSTGDVNSSDVYAAHMKFAVTPGKTYELGNVWGFAYYGADGEFDRYDNASLKGGKYDLLTIPDGIAFMSVNAQTADVNSGLAYVAENENTEYLGRLVNNLS